VCVVCGVHTHLHLYVRINTHTWICNCVYTIEHVDMRLCTHNLISTCSYFMCIHAARTFHVYSCSTHLSCVFMQHAPFMCIHATRTFHVYSCSMHLSCVFVQHAPAHVFVRDLTPIDKHIRCVSYERHTSFVLSYVCLVRDTHQFDRKKPPPGGGFYLLRSLIKSRE